MMIKKNGHFDLQFASGAKQDKFPAVFAENICHYYEQDEC